MNKQVCLLIVAALAWSSTRGCGLYAPSRHNTLDYKAIHAAAESGDLATVTILIKEDPRLVEAKDWANLTPLHLAVFHGHQDVVTFLLDKGANVNARTTDGITPLHEAAQIGSKELVE